MQRTSPLDSIIQYATVKQLTDFKCSYFEIYSNSRYIRRSKGIFHKPNKYTSLSNTAISDQQEPEQVVIVFRHVLAGVMSQWIALHLLFSHMHICASFAGAVCTDFKNPKPWRIAIIQHSLLFPFYIFAAKILFCLLLAKRQVWLPSFWSRAISSPGGRGGGALACTKIIRVRLNYR